MSWFFPSPSPRRKVLVTGATGYLGSHVVHQALEAGYEVVGTVRSRESPKCAFLRDAIAGKPGRMSLAAKSYLRLVEADLLSGEAAWEAVLAEGFEFVVHTASPFFAKEPKDPQDMIRPAVEGTTSILKAAIKAGVKRAVVTSSGAAIEYPTVDGKVYSAEDWSDPSAQRAYPKSKTLAERAAWDTVKGTGTELVVINPTFILGPVLYTDREMLTGFESGSIMNTIMTGGMPMQPSYCLGVCNVCDVAKAHIAALTAPQAAGSRFPICTQTLWVPEIVQMVADANPALGVKSRRAPNCLVWCMAFCDPVAQHTYKGLDKKWTMDVTGAKTVLNIDLTPVKATVKAMVDDFVMLKGSGKA
eukprot:CAMPEP_0179054098 /NCGR_PEP_ID=MMETSP0796-20121207/22613_1 /TAXON_ID=73915 /ORGANISM="Pyrodinium bahamense, Strain pbaha01" /LENGTH=358 /DNA_ID=CAMNT_0020750715 /DNA_START=49 /DNA_END=1125 /DNA_ORIENTATION=+